MAEIKHSDRDAEANVMAEDWWRYKKARCEGLPEHELIACRQAFYAGAAIGAIRELARVRSVARTLSIVPKGG